MQTVKFNAGDTIIAEGDEGNTAFLIVDGTVEVILGEGGKAKTIGAFGVGEVFGEMSLIEPGKRTATVKALTNTECIETSYDQFVTSIQDNPKAAIEFMKTLVRRLRHMNELMIAMDPKNRGLRQVFHEWQTSPRSPEPGWSDQEEKHRYEELMNWRMI